MSNAQTFHNSMKFKLWWRRMSISAPKMKIKTQWPWPYRALGYCLSAGIAAAALWGYDQGRVPGFPATGGKEQIAQLKDQVDKLTAERDQYSSTVNAAESRQNMDLSEQHQLEVQVKSLESENNKLKEYLAFFESLLPVDANAQGVSIRRIKTDLIAPNQLHYQLLVMQGGKGDHDFIGNVQLTVTVLQAGKSVMMVFPDSNTSANPGAASTEADKFKLAFKHYQRVEGTVTLPEGAVAKAVQARILDKGQIRAQQSVNL
jgi:hypothetical protein